MIVHTREQLRKLIEVEFVRFCIVGGTGFVINLAILKSLEHLGIDVWLAQFIGAEVALGSNFTLHNKWTYKKHNVKKSINKLIIQFHATSWPAILGSTIMVGIGEKTLHLSNLIALATSSVIVLAWNFTWSKYVVWRNITPKQIEEIVK